MFASVSIVRAESEDFALLGVSGTGSDAVTISGVSVPPTSLSLAASVAASLISAIDEADKTSDGRRVSVNRLLKRNSSVSGGVGSGCTSSISGWGVLRVIALARRCTVWFPRPMPDTGGWDGFCSEALEPPPETNWSREADARRRGLRGVPPTFVLERSWSREAEALSPGLLNPETDSLPEALALALERLSLEAAGRIVELGRGIVEVGFGMAEAGLALGRREGRGMPLVRFGVSSILEEARGSMPYVETQQGSGSDNSTCRRQSAKTRFKL